jgi:hypothetical protein
MPRFSASFRYLAKNFLLYCEYKLMNAERWLIARNSVQLFITLSASFNEISIISSKNLKIPQQF